MTEPVLALKWLNTILVPDATLTAGVVGGWHYIAPAGVRSPFGIVRPLASAEDLTGLDMGVKIWTPVIIQIILYDRDQQNFSRIDPLAQYIYDLLQGLDGTMMDGLIFACHRSQVEANYEPDGEVMQLYVKQHFTIEGRSN